MPRAKRTTVKSEHHAELARRSIEGRTRDPAGHWLPRTPVTGEPPAPTPPPPAPAPVPAPDPSPARPRRNPATFRARA